MIQDYVPVLLHIIVAVGFATVALLANIILGRAGTNNPTKNTAYECGITPVPGPQPSGPTASPGLSSLPPG